MRSPAYKDEEIIDAATKLAAKGKNVTGHALSVELGGGRPDRLKSVWEKYLLEQQDISTEKKAILSPKVQESFDVTSRKLIESLQQLFVSCEQNINQNADQRMAQEQLIYVEKMKIVEEQLRDADIAINISEDRIDELLAERQKLEAQVKKLHDSEKLIVELQTRLDTFNKLIEEKERLIEEQACRIEDLVCRGKQLEEYN